MMMTALLFGMAVMAEAVPAAPPVEELKVQIGGMS